MGYSSQNMTQADFMDQEKRIAKYVLDEINQLH